MKLALNIFLVVVSCLPFMLLSFDMAGSYSPDTALIDIGLIDAVLLVVSLSLPLCLLSRLGVNWRRPPEEC